MNAATPTARAWTFKAVTPIWTGDVDRKGARLVTTGILGSIRWWFELVVRGLNGWACDPTHHKDNKSGPCPVANVTRASDPGHHCVVCELFGCTGWARKFRLQVLDGNGKALADAITKDSLFALHFVPLRSVAAEEWVLLDLTLQLIAQFGALGGKTVFKPSDQQGRSNQPHHRDYGLAAIESRPDLTSVTMPGIAAYVRRSSWRTASEDAFDWASLRHFWCVTGRYLARQDANGSTFNKVVGRKEPKGHGQDLRPSAGPADKWLAGKQQESKKVFSFKSPPRTFGFVMPGLVDFQQMRGRLRSAWPDLRDDEVVEGPAILARLLRSESGAGS